MFSIMLLLAVAQSPSVHADSSVRNNTPTVHVLDGVYRFAGGDTLAIARVDDQHALMMLNVTTGAMRVLTADSSRAGCYTFGRRTFEPTPATGELCFTRDAAGAVTGVEEAAAGARVGRGKRLAVDARDLRIAGDGGSDLAGTLLTPAGSPPATVAVLLNRGGPATRWSNFDLALPLLNGGVAVFIYDTRNSGESRGDPLPPTSYMTASTILAGDAAAIVNALQRSPYLPAARIGVVGWSEGGWLGALVAARSPDLAFYVNIAGNGSPGNAQYRYATYVGILDAGFSKAQRNAALKYVDAYLGVLMGTVSWQSYQAALATARQEEWFPKLAEIIGAPGMWSKRGEAEAIAIELRRHPYRPAADYAKVHVPALGIFFGRDDQTSPESECVFKTAVLGGGNSNLELVEFPTLDHAGFVVPRLTHDTRFVEGTNPGLYSALVGWVARRARPIGSSSLRSGFRGQ
jgi:pimeloyl-ACP methyl ester carboxylesterase